MTNFRRKFDEVFKKNAVKLSYASPKTIKEIAEDLEYTRPCCTTGEENILQKGIKRSTQHWKRKIVLFGELAETRMERDMLKKAAA